MGHHVAADCAAVKNRLEAGFSVRSTGCSFPRKACASRGQMTFFMLPVKQTDKTRNILVFCPFFHVKSEFLRRFSYFLFHWCHLSAFEAELSAFLRYSTDKSSIFKSFCPYAIIHRQSPNVKETLAN